MLLVSFPSLSALCLKPVLLLFSLSPQICMLVHEKQERKSESTQKCTLVVSMLFPLECFSATFDVLNYVSSNQF